MCCVVSFLLGGKKRCSRRRESMPSLLAWRVEWYGMYCVYCTVESCVICVCFRVVSLVLLVYWFIDVLLMYWWASQKLTTNRRGKPFTTLLPTELMLMYCTLPTTSNTTPPPHVGLVSARDLRGASFFFGSCLLLFLFLFFFIFCKHFMGSMMMMIDDWWCWKEGMGRWEDGKMGWNLANEGGGGTMYPWGKGGIYTIYCLFLLQRFLFFLWLVLWNILLCICICICTILYGIVLWLTRMTWIVGILTY